jgi:hypothetical protein
LCGALADSGKTSPSEDRSMPKPQTPALGIMRTAQYDDADVYRVACSCGDHNHDVLAWIEAREETDLREIEVTFFLHGRSPSWKEGWSRWRAIWDLLWHGHHESENTLLLDRQAALNLSSAIRASVDRLEESTKLR